MRLRYTKGLSTVVTTLIIILLVLVAIGIVWVVIRGVVETGSQQVDISTKCTQVDIRVISNGTCDSLGCTYTVRRTSGGEASGVFYRIAAYDGSSTGIYDSTTEIAPLVTRTDAAVTLAPSLTTSATEISITPFFKVDGEAMLCQNSNTYKAV